MSPALLLVACGADPPTAAPVEAPCAPLVVLAAADLRYALEAVVALPAVADCPPTLSFGSSGTFATQIEAGAPADLYFAANESYVDGLATKGLVVADTRRRYAVGRIVLVGAPTLRAPLRTLQDLQASEIRTIAIANPDHAPYGVAAREALQATNLWDALQPKLVFGENIAQATELVRTGNADAGIVARSLAKGTPDAEYAEIPADLHAPLHQAAAVVATSPHPEEARAFLEVVLGPDGRAILETFGFAIPADP